MNRYIFLWACLFATFTLSAQNVSNVNATQAGQTIHITYDLDRAADISVFVSTDGGGTYTKLVSVSGDVGKTVGPGHKTIVWDVHSDMEDFVSDDIRFKVQVEANAETEWRKLQRPQTQEEKAPVEEKRPKREKTVMPYSTLFTLNMAYSPLPQWSFGFKAGGVKKVGWYVNLMTNFNFAGWGNSFYNGQSYYLTGESKTIRFSAQAGFVYRPHKIVSLLFGVGYGYRALTYKTNVYDNGSYLYSEWRTYPDRTYNGVDVSLGLLFDIKGFALSAEAVTTNFQTFEMRFGMGFCLPHKKSNN